MKNIKFAAMAFAVLLSACADAPPDTATPDLTFDQVSTVPLNVSRIEVIDNFNASLQPPHVEHLFKPQLDEAAKRLVEKQLVANGTENILRVIIEDASVTEAKLPVAKGVVSAFKNEPEFRYNGQVILRFELASANAPDIVIGNARVTANRATSAMENISLAEKDRMFLSMSEKLMKDLSDGLQTIVMGTFGTR